MSLIANETDFINLTYDTTTPWEFLINVDNLTTVEPPEWFTPVEIVLWTVVLVVILVVGIVGNCLVIAVVARTKDLRSSTNLLLVNLAGADLMVLLVQLPTGLVELHSMPEVWVLGKALCKYLRNLLKENIFNTRVFLQLIYDSRPY